MRNRDDFRCHSNYADNTIKHLLTVCFSLFISTQTHTFNGHIAKEYTHTHTPFIMEIFSVIHIVIIIILCSYKMLIKMPSETPCTWIHSIGSFFCRFLSPLLVFVSISQSEIRTPESVTSKSHQIKQYRAHARHIRKKKSIRFVSRSSSVFLFSTIDHWRKTKEIWNVNVTYTKNGRYRSIFIEPRWKILCH